MLKALTPKQRKWIQEHNASIVTVTDHKGTRVQCVVNVDGHPITFTHKVQSFRQIKKCIEHLMVTINYFK